MVKRGRGKLAKLCQLLRDGSYERGKVEAA